MNINMKKPNEQPVEIESAPGKGYCNWRELIGGWVECASYADGIDMYADEEGRLKNLVPNFHHPQFGDVVGTVIFAARRRVSKGKVSEQVIPVSLSQSQVRLIMGQLTQAAAEQVGAK